MNSSANQISPISFAATPASPAVADFPSGRFSQDVLETRPGPAASGREYAAINGS
jgi:hypothetical protein